MSRYDGVLMGVLPYSGEYELRTYSGAILTGFFSEPLRAAIRACPSSILVWLNRQCILTTDDDLKCSLIELNEAQGFSSTTIRMGR